MGQVMSDTLEIDLNSDKGGVRLAGAVFRDGSNQAAQTPEQRHSDTDVKGRIFVAGEKQPKNLEPRDDERIRQYGKPQIAFLTLVLRAHASGFQKRRLSDDESPDLARFLVGAIRKQTKGRLKVNWLCKLLGVSGQSLLGNWFSVSGNGSREARNIVGLSDKWSSIGIQVKINKKKLVVPKHYYDLATALEQRRPFDPPADKIAVTHFQLLVWNRALNHYTPVLDAVKEGDRIQLQISTDQKAHIYVVWLDQKAEATPLHPWLESKWHLLRDKDDLALDTVTIPDSQPNEAAQPLRIEGPRGIEHIFVLISPDAIDSECRKQLRLKFDGLKRHGGCPQPECLSWRTFAGWTSSGKVYRSVHRLEAPNEIKAFQAELAKPFQPLFDQVLICTFKNEGKIGR